MDGVKSAKKGEKKNLYVLKVLESKVVFPSHVKKALPKEYEFKSLTIEAVGAVEKKGDNYLLTARGSKQSYALKANDELKKLVADGKTKLRISGKVKESEEKDPPRIEVAEAKEVKDY